MNRGAEGSLPAPPAGLRPLILDEMPPAPVSPFRRLRETVRGAVVGQAMWLVAGRVLGAGFAAVWLLVAARALQPEAFGRVAVIIGLGTLMGVLTEGGLPLLVVEAVGADPATARPVVARTLAVRLPLTAGGALLLVGVAGLLYPSGALVAGLYGISLVASAAQTTAGSALRASGRVVAEAVSEAAGRLAILLVGLVFISLSPTGTAVAGAYAVGGTVTALALGWHAWRRLPARPPHAGATGDGAGWSVPVRRALHLGTAAVLVTAYNRIDLWLLAALASNRAAGLYAAAYRFFEGVILPATAFGALLVPVVARTAPAARRRAVLTYVGAAVGLTAAAAGILIVAAGPLVHTFLGDSFGSSVSPLRLLAIAALPSAAFGVISPLASLGHRRAGINFLVVGAAVNALVNLSLIPTLGPSGAAMAQILSQTVLALLFWRSLSATLAAAPQSLEPAP